MSVSRAERLLLTPGPLTTAERTRRALLRDWGSRDGDFIALTARVRRHLNALAGGGERHTCIPLQGSGTFAVEAMLGTLVPRDTKLAILVNGAYGRRMAEMCRRTGREHCVLESAENCPVDPDLLDRALREDEHLSHVALVHCETTSGVLNPLEAVAEVTSRHGRKLLLDAMSSFGALPIDFDALGLVALAASANKCLEGVPGIAYVICDIEEVSASAGNAHTLSLDLHAQWRGFETNGQWRFTPPTHVLAALDEALLQHDEEGGVAGRGARYAANCRVLVEGMRSLGFATLLEDAAQAPIIVTFRMPGHPRFDFERFYAGLAARGFTIYPGKLTQEPSFRIGCIGQVYEQDMREVVAAAAQVLEELGVDNPVPAD